MFNMAKDDYRIGKNPKLIHNYVKRIMLQDGFRTTPMNNCDYIVMGEQNHEIVVRSNGYLLGKKKYNSEGILTIGRVFQLNSSEDEVFTLANPHWRDNCLSFALAKMLRRRFAKLPVDEAGCSKALDFVLEVGLLMSRVESELEVTRIRTHELTSQVNSSCLSRTELKT